MLILVVVMFANILTGISHFEDVMTSNSLHQKLLASSAGYMQSFNPVILAKLNAEYVKNNNVFPFYAVEVNCITKHAQK